MTKLLLLFLVAATLVASISEKKPDTGKALPESYAKMEKGADLLQDGDLVVRNFNDAIGQAIRQLNKQDAAYSHAGVVLIENGYPFVYHMYMDGRDWQGSLHRDSFSTFCSPLQNKGIGVFRYRLTADEVSNVRTLLKQWRQDTIRFDLDFDLQTDNRLYCSEMVAKLMTASTKGRIAFQKTSLNPAEKLLSRYSRLIQEKSRSVAEYIAIDNLYINPGCISVCAFTFDP